MSGDLAKILCAAVAGVVLAMGPLSASGEATAAKIAGSYEMRTFERGADGGPACVEHWTLRASGTFVIDSGQEKMEGHWRTEDKGAEGQLLIWTDQTTNGLPDCRGHVTPQPVADRATYYYVNALGGLNLVTPDRQSDGSIVWQLRARATRIEK